MKFATQEEKNIAIADAEAKLQETKDAEVENAG